MIKIDCKPLQIWSCKIGECPDASVPRGADNPMRDAVADAYKRLTGHDPSFIFSGWNDELTEYERAAQENRMPDPLRVTMVVHVSTFYQAREALKEMIKVAEVGLRLAGNDEKFIAIRLKKSKDVLAAMEATHE